MKYQDVLAAYGGTPTWWKWKNFTPKEVSCKHCGEIWDGGSTTPPKWFVDAMDALQRLRNQWGKPIVINSGHRCKVHNKEVGGVSNSQHYTHIAFDCRCPAENQWNFAWIAKNAGFKYTQLYQDRGFVHCDLRFGK